VRRALDVVLSVAASVSAVSAAAPAATAAAPDDTRTITVAVEIWKASAAQTPGGKLDYCAVAPFVAFDDLDGWRATKVDYAYTSRAGVPTTASDPLEAPYDDAFTWGPLSKPSQPGRHQEMLGEQASAWKVGSADCEDSYALAVASFGPGPTATVTYERTAACVRARSRVAEAHKRLERARRADDRATRVQEAERQLAAAKRAQRRNC
jgi:hypothetical protein